MVTRAVAAYALLRGDPAHAHRNTRRCGAAQAAGAQRRGSVVNVCPIRQREYTLRLNLISVEAQLECRRARN
jgi:hypothetical protein